MPVNILVSARSIKGQRKNGDAFTLNPGDDTTHLKGSVMGRVLATHSVDISWNAFASQQDLWRTAPLLNPVTQVGNVTQITRESGDFVEADGFADGDEINFTFNTFGGGTFSGGAFVLIVNPSTVVLDRDIGAGVNTFGIIDATGATSGSNFVMRGVTDLTALKFKFGLPENSEAINFISKIQGTEQSYNVDNLGLIPDLPAPQVRDTSFQIGESSERFKGWVTGSLKARFVGGPAAFVQRFEIVQEFIILPYLKVDDAEAVFQLTESLNSLRYAFQADFRTFLSNPNTSKTVIDDFHKGSVGTYGENFNGINKKYSITSVVMVDALANTITTLEIGTTNTVTVVVASDNGTFIANQPFIVYHSYLPTADRYAQDESIKELTFEEVWFYENKRNLLGAVANSGTIITDVSAVVDNPNQITVTFDITYSTAQQAVLSDAEQFVLAIEVGDDSLSTDKSDAVMLDFLVANYTQNTDVPGLVTDFTMEMFDHPTDIVPGTGFTDVVGVVEDGILTNTDFNLELSLDAFIESWNVDLIAFNAISGESFVIQANSVDITSQVEDVPEGAFFVQEINIDTVRGFILAPLDQFNFFKLTTGALVGSKKPYNLQFGIKADWRESLILDSADPAFYDNTKILNGLNHLMSNYIGNGYTLHINTLLQVSNGIVTTPYNFRTPALVIQDYDDSTALDWECTIRTFNTANVSLDGKISSTENTRIEVTFHSPTINVTNVALYWTIIRIEQANNTGLNAIEELSSERGGVKDQLIPLVGQTQTKKSAVANDLIVECLVDFTKLINGIDYTPSARFGLGDSAAPLAGKLKEDGDSKFKEDGDTKDKE